jgi:hypothetical protein
LHFCNAPKQNAPVREYRADALGEVCPDLAAGLLKRRFDLAAGLFEAPA